MTRHPDPPADGAPDRLQRALRDVVPEPPAAPDRVAGALARARRRRRRRAGVVAMGSAAAVAAVSLLVAGTGAPPDDAPAPAAPSITAGQGPEDLACPQPVRQAEPLPDVTDDAPLPAGAVVARLCPVHSEELSFHAPADALVTDVGEVVEALTTAPEVDAEADMPCTADLGISWWIALAYPDGSTRVVQGENYGCGLLYGAGPPRTGSHAWATYLRLLRAQREELGAPPASSTPSITCPVQDVADSPLARPLEARHAVLAWRPADGRAEDWACAPVPDADLRVLLSSLRDPATRHRPTEQECRTAPLRLALVGVDVWGDIGTVHGDCGVWYVGDGGDSHRLDGPAQAVVDRIAATGG